jgi:hypothetical protein
MRANDAGDFDSTFYSHAIEAPARRLSLVRFTLRRMMAALLVTARSVLEYLGPRDGITEFKGGSIVD